MLHHVNSEVHLFTGIIACVHIYLVTCLEYNIIPEASYTCTIPPCCTLLEFATNFSLDLTSNTTLILAPGTHYLDGNLTISNVETISMLSTRSAAQILCENSSFFSFYNCTSLKLTNINFLGCGNNKVTKVKSCVVHA